MSASVRVGDVWGEEWGVGERGIFSTLCENDSRFWFLASQKKVRGVVCAGRAKSGDFRVWEIDGPSSLSARLVATLAESGSWAANSVITCGYVTKKSTDV